MPNKRKKLRSRKDLDKEFESLLRLAARLKRKPRLRLLPKPAKKSSATLPYAARA